MMTLKGFGQDKSSAIKKSLVKGLAITLTLGSLSSITQAAPKALWSIDNLDQPESVLVDEKNNALYISSINGNPVELNGKGYISKANKKGQLLDKQWIKGLNAPKGMAQVGNRLYVADMQQVHIIDIKAGKLIRSLSAPKAKMLNDITATPDGTLYITDLLGGDIYRLKDNQLTPWLRSNQLAHPNGILWHKGELLVANWGYPLNADFTTNTPGSLYRLSLEGQTLTPVPTGYQLGNLDGVVALNDRIWISDWISGELYSLDGKERIKQLQSNKGLADIGGSGDTIYAPMMWDNKVIAWQVD